MPVRPVMQPEAMGQSGSRVTAILAQLVSLLPLPLQRLLHGTYLRYALASVIALAIDMGSFLALLQMGVLAALASGISYSAGILAHWLVSSRAVFTGSVAARGSERTRQKALFVGSALLGLGLTVAIVAMGDLYGFDARLAKLLAIVVSFQATWLVRRHVVFRADAA